MNIPKCTWRISNCAWATRLLTNIVFGTKPQWSE